MLESVEIQQIQEKWIILWRALGIGMLGLAIAWQLGLFTVFRARAYPIIKGIDVLKGFGYYLFAELLLIPALIIILFVLAGWGGPDTLFLNEKVKGWLNLLIILGGFAAVSIAYFELTAKQRSQLWVQTSHPWYYHLMIGISAWFVIYPIVLAFSQIISIGVWYLIHHEALEQVAVQNLRKALLDPWLFGLTALAVVTLVPLTEEFLFRGLLQSWLKRKFHNTTRAILASSLVFSLFHFSTSQGTTNIELLSSLFMLSCALGFIYERQRSLWAPVGLHGFFNLVSLLFIFQE